MNNRHMLVSLATLLAGAALSATSAGATVFQLTYTGTFETSEALNLASDAGPTYFTASTPFTVKAVFDDSGVNYAPSFGGPFNGFRAYSPSAATLTVGSQTFSIENIVTNPGAGITVAIFDQHSFSPGHYAVGILADPVNDGAGVIGDFLSASPNFIAASLVPTVFGDYYGVGHGSGVCAATCAITPLVLHDASSTAWNLTLGNFNQDYPVSHDGGITPVGPLNTAVLTAVPEPAAWALMIVGFAAVGGTARVARRSARLAT